MISVDTNILIRLITNDVPQLRERAQALLQAHRGEQLFVPDVVLAELFFVLQYSPQYKLNRADVCGALSDLLSASDLTVSTEAAKALRIAASKPRLDFTDCLLAIYANSESSSLLSFDKELLQALR